MGYVGDGPKPQLEVGDISTKDVTATGDLTVDTNTLYVDSTNNNVGIGGTPASGRTVHVQGTGFTEVVVEKTDATTAALLLSADSGLGSIYTRSTVSDSTAIPLTFHTGNTERMRIDSSGVLLVGTTDDSPYNNSAGTSADNGFVVSGGRLWAARYSGTPLDLNRTGDDGGIINFRQDGTVVGSIKCRSSGGNLQINTGQSGIDFGGDGYLPMRNGSILDNDLDIGSSSFRYADLYLSGGAYLGGTGSANKLDDYEEGTWTATTNQGSVTTNGGTYTKIGNQVTIRANLADFTNFSDGSAVQITGLPFTSASNSYGVGACMIRFVNTGGYEYVQAYLGSNTGTMFLYTSDTSSNANWTPITYSDANQIWDIIFTLSYIV